MLILLVFFFGVQMLCFIELHLSNSSYDVYYVLLLNNNCINALSVQQQPYIIGKTKGKN